MFSIITGSIIISLLHAVIPNHWLPVIAIGRKEQWTIVEVTKVTFTCALAHGISTILIGVILSFLGAKLDNNITHFTNIIAPSVLIILGIFFIYRHHHHKHFHIDSDIKNKKTKNERRLLNRRSFCARRLNVLTSTRTISTVRLLAWSLPF